MCLSLTDDSNRTRTVGGWIFWAFVWGAVGYLIYGSAEGAIALALFSALGGIALCFGAIPIVGVAGTYYAMNYLKVWMLQSIGISMSWAISTIFWLVLAGSVLLTVLVILLIVSR